MKEQEPKSRDCLKKFNGVEVFMCATTCAGLENCLIKRQRGEPVSDIISENYAPFKASVADVRVSGETPKPAPTILEIKNSMRQNYLDEAKIQVLADEFCSMASEAIEDHQSFIDGFITGYKLRMNEHVEFMPEVSGEAKTPDERVKELEGECFRLAACQCHGGYGDEYGNWRCKYQDAIQELSGGSVPTPSDEE